jgi:tetratricopeptide (TPR) repeat protein
MRNILAILIFSTAVMVGGVALWLYIEKGENSRLPGELEVFELDKRPQSERYLFDYAAALRHYEEAAHGYLKRITSRFHIEALIVSVPALPAGYSVETLAVDLVNNWRIGADHEGRGLLLLLVGDAKKVKLEVSYELEDVFTDAFSGYVEDLQLGPYYRAGDVGTGLIAVMELLEQRAQIKNQGEYTPEQIKKADAELLAGGAGAARDLASYANQMPKPLASQALGKGARSPAEAWEIMLLKWSGEGEKIDVDVYTQMTRLAMGDPENPDSRALSALDYWRNTDYQVLTDGQHAVIWFGAIDGWNNAPFLFCNTGAGWKFDIVHQRRLVVMAEAPKWKVSQGPYPYTALMSEASQSTGKDLPLTGDDLYRCFNDAAIAGKMRDLQTALTRNPEDIEATIKLARLNVITGRRPNHVRPLLERAKKMAPARAEPYKYSAIFNVNSFFQYSTALKDMEHYIKRRPDDAFGYNFKGFLLYRIGQYADSIDALEEAIARDPANGYTYALLARDYTLLYSKASGLTKDHYRKKALAMQRKAANVPAPDLQRLHWLQPWMQRRLR